MHRTGALLAAMVLALCVAAPAIAEVGCSADTAAHFAEADAEAAPSGGGDAGGETDRDSHCAFAHGHGSLAAAGGEQPMLDRKLSFGWPPPAQFVSLLPSGLDRPPRA